MRFLDVRTDFAFKKVFGSEDSKDILLSFINALIDFGGGRKVTDLTIVDPYNIPLLKGMKDTYVDVKAVLNDNSRVIIEMQVLNHEGFEKRILYNAAKNYSIQLGTGEQYHLLNPVIALTLTDFTMFDDTHMKHCFKLLDKDKFITYSDDIELIFFELPKFDKAPEELITLEEKWLYFVKNAGSLNLVPKNLETELQKAFTVINEAGMSEEELEIQHKKREWIFIQKSSLALAERKGMEQGIQQGIQQAILGIARNAHAAGLPMSTIVEITGLNEEQLINLLKS